MAERLSKRNRVTLEAIFSEPTAVTLKNTNVESLLKALGGTIRERKGSAVSVILDGAVMVWHRPHPGPTLKQYQVRNFREFLKARGITK